RILLSGLIILTISAAAMSQGARKVIVWTGDPECGFKSRAVDKPETVFCDSIPTERGPVSTITYDGVTLAAAFLEDGDRFIVGAQIRNDTDEVIGFDSDRWGAAHYRSRDEMVRRELPILAETSIPSRDIIRRMASGTRLENSLGDFMGDMQVVGETREIRRNDGTKYKTTVIVPDKNAAAHSDRIETNRTELSESEQRRLRKTALTAKSVRAGDSVRGLVYFRRIDDSAFVVYSLKVADVTFVFMVPWRR
ncbi:MAG: hypothetical protein AB7J13_13715, partial [Pyrinomonadaceae bacterium]